MVASPNMIKQSGAQSATFIVPSITPPDAPPGNGSLNELDWAGLPTGKLKDLLNRKYLESDLSTPDFAAFFDAMAQAGFSCVVLHQNNMGPGLFHGDSPLVALDGSGYPTITVVTSDIGPYIARLQTSYSASE